jgi:hypothetical protein
MQRRLARLGPSRKSSQTRLWSLTGRLRKRGTDEFGWLQLQKSNGSARLRQQADAYRVFSEWMAAEAFKYAALDYDPKCVICTCSTVWGGI